ncbi:MAG: ABC transporter ATP-binding protein, partial [Lachnospira sp.]|nr:ABC transporter ATP-binding protein [Lachnospira sp.]
MAGPTGIPGMRGPGGGAGHANMRGRAAKPKNMKNTILRLMKYMSKTKAALVAAIFAAVVSTVCNLAASYMIRP